MKLIHLYIENFMCYESTELDLSNFQSVLIIATIDNNDLFSNGAGKSTIFKAIEYVLFNKARNLNLEKIVREDTSKCKVSLDFETNGKIYRVCRSRTIKGSTDLSLWERNAFDDVNVNPHSASLTEEQIKLFWTNISSRRIPDTELDLQKLHKINFEAFLATNHFVQNDFISGLAAATPSQRQKSLKEALQLVIYSKLEKIVSEEIKLYNKDVEKKRIAFNAIGDPSKDIKELSNKLKNIEFDISNQNVQVEQKKTEIEDLSYSVSELSTKFSRLESQSSSFIKNRDELIEKIKKTEKIVEEANQRMKNTASAGKTLIKECSTLKEQEKTLKAHNLSVLESLKLEAVSLREHLGKVNANISNTQNELTDLKIPLPDDSLCKHCRQPLTDTHRQACKDKIIEDIKVKEKNLKTFQQDLSNTKKRINIVDNSILELSEVKKQLDVIFEKISSKNNEIVEKKNVHEEYVSLWKKSEQELNETKNALEQVQADVNSSSSLELEQLITKIADDRQKVNFLKKELESFITILNKNLSDKAVLEHSIGEKQKDLLKREILKKEIQSLEDNYSVYPDVLEAFSPRGIPNLIIQNILDDLQVEVNNLLSQLKPGLQLSFVIEKEKENGEINDDLEINYFLNGRSRDYGQLSGAMVLCVLFSLKLGLSFLLQKRIGAEVKFLLIDEIDPPLDKAGVDAFANIIKFFQKDFTILVITHNDRLSEKFSHAILVEQDRNMISKAKVVSSW